MARPRPTRAALEAEADPRRSFNPMPNACKFTERGTVTLPARQEPAADGSTSWLVFEVADTGIGMTDEQRGWFFEALSRRPA